MPRVPRRRSRGTGTVYRKGRLWSVSWMESGERRYAHGFTSKDQAEKVRSLNAANLAAGRGGLPKPKGPGKTLAVLAEEWLARRDATHRAARDDRHRWTNHLEPLIGDLEPDAVDTGLLRKIVERKLGEKLASATVLLLMRLLSTFYTDLIEQGHATKNPVRMLPRSTKRLIRPSHDPKTTPFVEKRADIVRIFKALPEPVNVAYAIGALAGLRTGEILGLPWEHVDLRTRRIHVQASMTGRLKDDESRVVPIVDGLAVVLSAWREKRPDGDLVITPVKKRGLHMRQSTLRGHLDDVLEKLHIPKMTFYQATRHTFASHWVLTGGSIERLRDIMGHSTVSVTERYAHLKPDLFPAKELERADLDLGVRT
jgi:integrase/recombinase XerD